MYTAKGEIYKGNFFNDFYHGEGEQTFPGEYTYKGEFFMGTKQGQGELSLNDGTIVQGNFEMGIPKGKVHMHYPSGDYYVGEVLEWKRHGSGTLTRKGISTFTGSFNNDLEDGLGRLMLADGQILLGAWNQGVKFGEYVYIDALKGKHRFFRYESNGHDYKKVTFSDEEFRDPFFNQYNRIFKMDKCLNKVLQGNLSVFFRKLNNGYLSRSRLTESESESAEIQKMIRANYEKKYTRNEVIPQLSEQRLSPPRIRRKSWSKFNKRNSSKLKTTIKSKQIIRRKDSFLDVEIIEAFKDGNLSKLRSIYSDVKTGNINPMHIFSLRDHRNRTILHLVAFYGHYKVLLHLCCILKILKRKKKNLDLVEILKAVDDSGNTPIDLLGQKGYFKEEDVATLNYEELSLIDKHFTAIEEDRLTFSKEPPGLELFKLTEAELNNLKEGYLTKLQNSKLTKDYVTLLEDGEKDDVIRGLSFSVVSKRAYCYQVFFQFLTSENKSEKLLLKKEYDGIKSNPLHWAIYWADLFSVLYLLEFDYNMIFWGNEEKQGPLEIMFRTHCKEREHQAKAIFSCIIDELYRVLYYKFVKSGYFPIDISENFIADNMDDRFIALNTHIENASFIFEDKFLCERLLAKFFSRKPRTQSLGLRRMNTDVSIDDHIDYLMKLSQSFRTYFPTKNEKLIRFKRDSRWMFEHLFVFTIAVMSSEHYDYGVLKILDINPFIIRFKGMNIIHMLAENNEGEALQDLIEHCVDKIRSKAHLPFKKRKKLLNELMESLNTPEQTNLNTPLHIAIIKRSYDVLDCLLEYEIDIDIPNFRGWTARELMNKLSRFEIKQSRLVTPDKLTEHIRIYFSEAQKYLLKNASFLRIWKSMDNDTNFKIFIKIIRGHIIDPDVVERTYEKSSPFFGVDLSRIQKIYARYYSDLNSTAEYVTQYLKEEMSLDNINVIDQERGLIEYINHIDKFVVEDLDSIKKATNKQFYRMCSTINLNKIENLEIKTCNIDYHRLYCLEVNSNDYNYQNTPIFEKMILLRTLYQDYEGGIKLDIIKGVKNAHKSCLAKILLSNVACIFGGFTWHKKLLNKYCTDYTHYYVLSFSDKLMETKATQHGLSSYNLNDNYYSSFKETFGIPDFEPLKDNQKLLIIHMMFHEVFSPSNYLKIGLLNAHYPIHDNRKKSNLSKVYKHSWTRMKLSEFFEQLPITKVRFISLFAQYFGLHNGYFIGFMIIYLRGLSFLCVIVMVFAFLFILNVIDTTNIDNYTLVMSGVVGIWSTSLTRTFKITETQLKFVFDQRLKSETSNKVIDLNLNYRAKTVLEKTDNHVTKSSLGYLRIKRYFVSLHLNIDLLNLLHSSYWIYHNGKVFYQHNSIQIKC